jgi:hypothetical protein
MLQLATHIECADQTLYVGDRDEDRVAADAANIGFIWANNWRDVFIANH